MHYLYPILLFLLSVLLFVGTYFAFRKDIYPHIKHKKDCTLPNVCNSNDKNCCAIWTDGYCRKAKLSKNGVCESKGDILPASLMILGMISFVAFIVALVMYVKNKGSKMQMRFW